MTDENPESGSRRVELCVRSLSPSSCRGQQEAVLDRLERLEAVGRIDEYAVEVWGDQLAETDARRSDEGRRIHEKVERFHEWATSHDRPLELCFETESVDSRLADEEYTKIVFPTMTLAEYGADGLRLVCPCTEGETVHSVTDRLDALEETSELPTDPSQSGDGATHGFDDEYASNGSETGVMSIAESGGFGGESE